MRLTALAGRPPPAECAISLGRLHAGQVRAHNALCYSRFAILRCGRRFGKTQYARNWIASGALNGETVAWFAPLNSTWAEVYADLRARLAPMIVASSRTPGVIRLSNGGRIDFFSLGNAISARGRGYHRVVIDEAAFAKDGDLNAVDSMAAIWQKAILPTLADHAGRALVTSNSAGKDSSNFFYNLCNDAKYGFDQFHATTMDNPLLPKREPGELREAWQARKATFVEELRTHNDPLVFAQEYLAEFVDWSGKAFFDRDKLLVDGRPVAPPTHCDCVFVVIDTATKTGADNDATAATFFAFDRHSRTPVIILDWDIVQIEGSLLEIWLPPIGERLERYARLCGARRGSIGAFIEDAASGTILLQQAARRRMPARAIASELTKFGKDQRALDVSGYVYRGLVKYSQPAYDKVVVYKGHSRNHLVEQIERFRMADKDARREDDLLDCFCYGIALTLGNAAGF